MSAPVTEPSRPSQHDLRPLSVVEALLTTWLASGTWRSDTSDTPAAPSDDEGSGTASAWTGPVLIDIPPGGARPAREGHPTGDGPLASPLDRLRDLAAQRTRVEAQMLEATTEVVARVGEELLRDKGFTSVDELTPAGRRRWRAEAKSCAVAEIELLLGLGVMAARRMVGVACAPSTVTRAVTASLERGEASLDLVLRFWERCAALEAEAGAAVANSLFGTDPRTAAVERLDPQGRLRERPWHVREFLAALEREAVRSEGRDEVAARERRRRARDERDTSLRVHDDGTATLSVRCPLTTGAAVHRRVDRASRGLRAAGDPRTLAQLRADVTAALLLHGVLPLTAGSTGGEGHQNCAPPRPAPEDDLVTPADLGQIARILAATPSVQLQVVVPWDVLAGRAAVPDLPPPAQDGFDGRDGLDGHDGSVGELLGVDGATGAFLTPEHLRVLALQPGTTLSRLLVDPADGRLVERSIETYRPDAQMRRQVRAADVTSRRPGSRRPAAACDLDHETPWGEGGRTSETNLNVKDRRSHVLKTRGWWRTTMTPDRDVGWTTLLGQDETTRCHDYRQYLQEALDRAAPLDPDQDGTHPALRTDRDERVDLACRAVYAALCHRGVGAHLADVDDQHGSTEHDRRLGGWVWVSHTNPDGTPRRGFPPDHPTVAEVLGTSPAGERAVGRAGRAGRPGQAGRAGAAGRGRRGPWATAPDDAAPPF